MMITTATRKKEKVMDTLVNGKDYCLEYSGTYFVERISRDEHGESMDDNEASQKTRLEVFKDRLYHGIMDLMKSTLIIFALLTLYKVSGLNTWWIQLVDTLYK